MHSAPSAGVRACLPVTEVDFTTFLLFVHPPRERSFPPSSEVGGFPLKPPLIEVNITPNSTPHRNPLFGLVFSPFLKGSKGCNHLALSFPKGYSRVMFMASWPDRHFIQSSRPPLTTHISLPRTPLPPPLQVTYSLPERTLPYPPGLPPADPRPPYTLSPGSCQSSFALSTLPWSPTRPTPLPSPPLTHDTKNIPCTTPVKIALHSTRPSPSDPVSSL